MSKTAEILLTKDEVALLAKAVEFIVRKEGVNLTKSEFDGLELNRLEDIIYDIKKQIQHGHLNELTRLAEEMPGGYQ